MIYARTKGKSKMSKCSILIQVIVAIYQWESAYAEAPTGAAASSEGSGVWLDFTHEKCQKEVLSSNQYKTFYHAKRFYDADDVLELLVRFKGIADGHIILTTNASAEEPRYTIGFGSYNNRFSELRRLQPTKVETKVSTPGIMSDLQFRGFIIRYDPHTGHLSVFGEGSDVALLHLEDSNPPLEINFFSFATWHNRVIQVAYNCIPKDQHSTVDIRSQDKANKSCMIGPAIKTSDYFDYERLSKQCECS